MLSYEYRKGTHLLKRELFSLSDINPIEGSADQAKKAKFSGSAENDAAQQVRRDLTNDEVVHTVEGCAKEITGGEAGHWPDFCDEDPSTGIP